MHLVIEAEVVELQAETETTSLEKHLIKAVAEEEAEEAEVVPLKKPMALTKEGEAAMLPLH